MKLNDAVLEMLTKYIKEEEYKIIEAAVTNYGRRGAIFVGMPSGNLMFATRRELRAMQSIHNHNEDVKLLLELMNTYKLYNEVVVAFVWEDSQELIKMAKLNLKFDKV